MAEVTRASRERDPERWKVYHWNSTIRGKYGLEPEEYDRILEEQEKRCVICGSKTASSRTNRLHVDHDRVTGKVRGLLCTNCNNGIGRFKDNPFFLMKAAHYLSDDREYEKESA